METINASELKAKCLAILDRVKATGESVLILKRGKPVAQLVPPSPSTDQYPQSSLKGTVKVLGDVVSPVLAEEDWEALRE